jgi:hypothetical protein
MFDNGSHETPPSDRPYERPRKFLGAIRKVVRKFVDLFFLKKRIRAKVSRLTRISLHLADLGAGA